MTETGGKGQSPEPQPRKGIEAVSTAEYRKSVSHLQEFAGKETHGIADILSLQAHMTGVGEALDTVIRYKGAVDTERKRRYLKQRWGEGENKKELTGNIAQENVTISVRSLGQPQKMQYYIEVPYTDRIAARQGDFFAEEYAQHVDERGRQESSRHMPSSEPNSPALQQAYAEVLQRSVADVLALANPPESMEGIVDPFPDK